MKTTLITFILFILLITACTKKDDSTTPTQTIVTTDSSNVAGRLYVDVYDVNGNTLSASTASLFLTYDDVKRNIPLYTISAGANGRVDFGYILQGNYYLTGKNTSGTLHDTTVAQVLPQRILTRKLILR